MTELAAGSHDPGDSSPSRPPEVPALSMRDMHKRYGDVHAVNGVSLSVQAAKVHAVVGENGAGKSTLMEMLAGSVRPDSGTIEIDGKPLRLRSVADAYAAGIGIVHQHFQLFPGLTVAENIVLGDEPRKRGSFDHARAVNLVADLGERYGLRVKPHVKVGTLSVGDQQRVEILRALYRGARILILDEPTAVLTPQECDGLFEIVRELCEDGRTVLFVSHKLKEVLAIADEITVMRRGVVTGLRAADETDPQDLTRLMVGRKVELGRIEREVNVGAPVLDVNGVNAPGLEDINLRVSAGEIVGVAGVDGNGQTELAEVLAGLRPIDSGEISAAGDGIYQDPRVRRRGPAFGYVPDDRYARGLARAASIAENLLMGEEGKYARKGFLNKEAIAANAAAKMKEFDVRAGKATDAISTLSGGNAQKVIIAREVSGDRKFVLASQPTRGIDVGAAEFIHRQLRLQADSGCAVLLISADLDELRALSDRIVVMYEGKIVGEVAGDVADEQEIGLLMAGIDPSTQRIDS